MTVEKTLRNSLILYPSLFTSKWDVYHHWFIVIGNGYGWVDGELVCDYGNDEQDTTLEEAIEKHFDFHASDRALLSSPLRFSIERLKQDIIETVNWEEKLLKPFSDEGRNTIRDSRIYPLSNYSHILNIPDDIKEDWKVAAKEMYEWLLNNTDKISEEDKEWVGKITIP